MDMPGLPSTVGIWLVTAFVEAILQGMGMLQGFLYVCVVRAVLGPYHDSDSYFTWYHKDPWSVKATVALLLAIECVQMGASIGVVYEWFITGFGDLDNLDVIHWQDFLQLPSLYLSMFVTQVHFARSIYQCVLPKPLHIPESLRLATTTPVDRKHIFLPSLILVLSLLAIGGGIAEVIAVIKVSRYSKLSATNSTYLLQTAAALAADILITFGLCWRLRKRRSEFQSTNKILNFLILTAINRSVFTMFFAILNMILFLTRPGTFAFMIALLISDKLYMNSLLAMLNTRQFAIQAGGAVVAEQISMPNFSSTGSHHNKQPGAVYIQTTREVRNDAGGEFELENMKIDVV
ncbi:hypothetical protein GGX14DRAFT_595533 [Mycena pura]|uniref:DUF6534 domain-containing protein n=1 Tax=Mycena pura TaxID=153505 RepID=A0AAD6YGI8_9AGAR|nr:hypothetical protein GGX14DRAFT_595533 [Mycena pura]